MLGDEFHGISIGTTVLNNTEFTAPVPEWQIDAEATRYAVEMLRENKGWESAPLDVRGVSTKMTAYNAAWLTAKKPEPPIWDAARRQGFDTLVVVRPGVSENWHFFVPSYGVFERRVLGMGWGCVYAAFIVNVYEVASEKSVAWDWGGGEMGEPCAGESNRDMHVRARFDDYSAEEKADLRKRVEARVLTSLHRALARLKLSAGR
ncbi:MAG TPA: hypothetical protein VLL50_10970 [Usitatibacter sp.]|nr:hypothetical protein [Usitatibacter sp.]